MENVQQNPLGTDSIPKLMFKFSVPSIIAMIVGALYNIVDQFYINYCIYNKKTIFNFKLLSLS